MSFAEHPSDRADLDARVARCRRVLDKVLEVGMNLVETLDPKHATATVRDPFESYCRISRALRLTLMLEARLAAFAREGAPAGAEARGRAEASEEADGESDQDEPMDRPERAEAGERAERGDPDEFSRMLSRPVTEVAATICRDLGLSKPEAGEVRSAFAALIANDDEGDPDPTDPDLAARVRPAGRNLRDSHRRWRGARLERGPP